MAKSLNKVQLIGNLGGEPEMRLTPTGREVTTLSLATTRTWKGADGQDASDTQWHRIELWGQAAKIVKQYAKKGSKMYLEGRLQTDKYEKDGQTHYSTKIVAHEFMFLGDARNGAPAGETVVAEDPGVGGAVTAPETEYTF